jgi:spore maturation protein CgeB
MKLVIFGLTISSSWGNGHATLWRGLCRSLVARGHEIHFFERDVPYYAHHRDLTEIRGGRLYLYPDWEGIRRTAETELADADVGMVTSYCPDGLAATDLVLGSPAACRCFYDLDTGVTLNRLRSGDPVEYIGPSGFSDFDLVLSYTGGKALIELQSRLGARRVAPLYGHVDPEYHHPAPPLDRFLADLSYLGTYAEDRQAALQAFFIEPARRLPERRFMLGGALYPQSFPWTDNIYFVRHLPPGEHPAFYCSSKLTLNVTRKPMAEFGYCPSGRLFEASACGVPILSDWFEGLDAFFEPGSEILVCSSTEQAIDAIQTSNEELSKIAQRGRERTLACHTSDMRAAELEEVLAAAMSRSPLNSQGALQSLEA